MAVSYQGSPYHMRYPSQWKAPALVSDKSACQDEQLRFHRSAARDLTRNPLERMEQDTCRCPAVPEERDHPPWPCGPAHSP
jgi:hypothetical protein